MELQLEENLKIMNNRVIPKIIHVDGKSNRVLISLRGKTRYIPPLGIRIFQDNFDIKTDDYRSNRRIVKSKIDGKVFVFIEASYAQISREVQVSELPDGIINKNEKELDVKIISVNDIKLATVFMSKVYHDKHIKGKIEEMKVWAEENSIFLEDYLKGWFPFSIYEIRIEIPIIDHINGKWIFYCKNFRDNIEKIENLLRWE